VVVWHSGSALMHRFLHQARAGQAWVGLRKV